MLDYAAKFETGLSYQAFLQTYGTEEQRQRWGAMHARISLSPAQQTLVASFTREMKVFCLAGAWCGDCVNQCPIFDHIAAANEKIHVRYFDRDANTDLGELLSVCGAPRVPVVLFVSEDNFQVGWYGDRTLSKYRRMAIDQLGAACATGLGDDEVLRQAVVQDWVNEFERIYLILRTSGRLRKLHND